MIVLIFCHIFMVVSIRVDKNADGRIGEEEVKEVSNKHWLGLELVVVQYEQFISLFFRPFFYLLFGDIKIGLEGVL